MNPLHSSKQIIVMEKIIYNPHQMAVCVLNFHDLANTAIM